MPSVRPAVLDGIAFAGMFVFGIVMALLGAVIPVVSGRLSLGLDAVGWLFLVMNAAMLVASLLVGPVMDWLGLKLPIALGGLLVAGGLASVARAGGRPELLAAVAALGFGGGALNAAANTLVADLHEEPAEKAAALNLLGVFFGFGALLLPFSIGALLSRAGLGALLFAAAALCALMALAAAVSRFPPAKQAHGWPVGEMARFARVPLVVLLAALLFFQSGNEFVLGGYFATFLTREFRVPIGRASYLLAGYWAAIMVARLLVSRTMRSLGARPVVVGGAVLAAVGAVAVAGSPGPSVAAVGIVITGLALAGIFPTVLGIAGAAFRDRSGTIFGILFTVALTGGTTMPWLAGQLAASAGLRSVFLLAAANFVVVAALGLASGSGTRQS